MEKSSSESGGVFAASFDTFGTELDVLLLTFFGDSHHLKVGSEQTRDSRDAVHPAFSSNSTAVALGMTDRGGLATDVTDIRHNVKISKLKAQKSKVKTTTKYLELLVLMSSYYNSL